MGSVLECCGIIQDEDLSPEKLKALGGNEDPPPPPLSEIPMNVLNERKGDTIKRSLSSAESVEMSHKFNKALRALKDKYFWEDDINYTGIKNSQEFKEYLEVVPDLDGVDLGVLSANEKKAFLINIYNALVIHATVVQGHPKNRPERQKFFSKTAYQIGEFTYCLKEIEHGLLRGNVIHPRTGKPNLDEGDPRIKFALDLDPRIHFALVCGGKSCPPVRFWKTETVEDDLERAAQSFVHHEVEVLDEEGVIAMNQILSWYRKDFTGDDEDAVALLNSLRKWMDEEQKEDIDEMENPKIVFKKYDWSLNGH